MRLPPPRILRTGGGMYLLIILTGPLDERIGLPLIHMVRQREPRTLKVELILTNLTSPGMQAQLACINRTLISRSIFAGVEYGHWAGILSSHTTRHTILWSGIYREN